MKASEQTELTMTQDLQKAMCGKLSTSERRALILDLIGSRRSLQVEPLAEHLSVSAVTVRKDLDTLAEQGLLIRTRGGAIAEVRLGLTTAFAQRAQANKAEKRRIGAAAARLVAPGDTILLDAGSTIMEMALALHGVSPLAVVTSAPNTATLLASYEGVRVTIVGGSLSAETISTYGPYAIHGLSDILVAKVFLAVHALDEVAGLMDPSPEIAQVKQGMIRTGRRIILLADSSKWGQRAFVKVAPLSAVHTVVTDSGLPPEAREALERAGVEVISA